ncbi:Subtilisin-like protease, partial [Thalictrum thalictroides]
SYVVYLGGHPHGLDASEIELARATDAHYDFLGSHLGSVEKAKDAIFYSYNKHINGFAAMLENEEAEAISNDPRVVSVFLNKGRKLHTTRSWDFLGLENNGEIFPSSLWNKASLGENTIIGNLDTGVWPESESFNDEGYGPIPSKWKGYCQNDTKAGVMCNRKLIGATYFNKGYLAYAQEANVTFDSTLNSARDEDGHGTHTLSTAGGNFVPRASVFGFGEGTAKGGSPKARVAAYKVCWEPINGSECFDADIMAALDHAIHDGVDVLSMSLGGTPADYFEDAMSIGTFHAVQKGIVAVCSAGNDGPKASTVSNISPWMFTVGASTIDREFPSDVILGNNKSFKGQSLSKEALPDNVQYPLISSVDARAANASTNDAQLCKAGSLDPKKVKGKILVCLRGDNARVDKGMQAQLAGAVAMVLANDVATGNEIIADAHVLPASHISYTDGLAVFEYINSTKSPVAYVTPTRTQMNTTPAPFMASFSSQGPNLITPEILKPDITAPGVSIIAAYTQAQGPTNLANDKRRVLFNSVSGTSMSCPHMAGVVGLLKTLHPDWSPAAIKSAVMTSAITRDNTRQAIVNASFEEATPFSYGAGHVWPNRAADPGLVYDLNANDYINFLCAIGYNQTQIGVFSPQAQKCSKSFSVLDLNYPSITVPNLSGSVTVTRTVKNVGGPSTYHVAVHEPNGVSVSVEPKSLNFEKNGEEKTFKVTLTEDSPASNDYVFGKLTWFDGKHYVRSPIVVKSS